MTPAKKAASPRNDSNEVDEFLRDLDHPRKADVETLRSVILGASPRISEGIKWNSPSFRVQEWFATFHLRKDDVMVILHLGAKVKDGSTSGMEIKDPKKLLTWLSKDRAAVRFPDSSSVRSNRKAFEAVVRQWIARLP